LNILDARVKTTKGFGVEKKGGRKEYLLTQEGGTVIFNDEGGDGIANRRDKRKRGKTFSSCEGVKDMCLHSK